MFESIIRRLRRKEQYHAKLRSVKTDPLTARHWHDATDPHQAARIEAAAAKRNVRALLRHTHARTSVAYNRTTFSWKGPFPDLVCRNNLNPFYIAK